MINFDFEQFDKLIKEKKVKEAGKLLTEYLSINSTREQRGEFLLRLNLFNQEKKNQIASAYLSRLKSTENNLEEILLLQKEVMEALKILDLQENIADI